MGVLDFLHDVAQQAGAESADLGVNVNDDVLVLDFVVFLYGNDDSGLDLFDQIVLGQSALLFQRSESLKKFIVCSSHLFGFLPIICCSR